MWKKKKNVEKCGEKTIYLIIFYFI